MICGAGLHGSALAYYLTVKARHSDVTVVEKHSMAAAASGKGGGFLARDWGSGPTVQLHEVRDETNGFGCARFIINSWPLFSVHDAAIATISTS